MYRGQEINSAGLFYSQDTSPLKCLSVLVNDTPLQTVTQRERRTNVKQINSPHPPADEKPDSVEIFIEGKIYHGWNLGCYITAPEGNITSFSALYYPTSLRPALISLASSFLGPADKGGFTGRGVRRLSAPTMQHEGTGQKQRVPSDGRTSFMNEFAAPECYYCASVIVIHFWLWVFVEMSLFLYGTLGTIQVGPLCQKL